MTHPSHLTSLTLISIISLSDLYVHNCLPPYLRCTSWYTLSGSRLKRILVLGAGVHAIMVQKLPHKLAAPHCRLPWAGGGYPALGGSPDKRHTLHCGFTPCIIALHAHSHLSVIKSIHARRMRHTRMHTLRAIPYTHTALRPHSCRVRYGD